ncbi:flagellar basal body rod protein FlgB [Rhizobium sp. PAMB 3182]
MQPIQLFELASKQAEWLSVRQELVANNIANANTPKYVAKDVTPFSAVLTQAGNGMARTNSRHVSSNTVSENFSVVDAALSDEDGIKESGNTVSLAGELTKSGEIRREFELNAALVKSFHRMMLMAVKR